ncbi:MAG: hypothetical protein ACOCWO_03370 [Candidatus Muiribacteriaceae bacterium]
MYLTYCDLNILPEDYRSFTDKFSESVGGEETVFSFNSLKALSGLYDAGYRDFTVLVCDNTIRRIFPRNTQHRNFSLWLDLKKDRFGILLKDNNSSVIVEHISKDTEGLFGKKELFAESSFYVRKISEFINSLTDKLFSEVNIKKEEMMTICITGCADILSFLYDLPSPRSYSRNFFGRIPLLDSSDMRIMLPEGTVPENIIDSDVPTGFFLIADMLAEREKRDFIIIYDDVVACFSVEEKRLFYIYGIVEEAVQEKVVSYYRDNYLKLPLRVFDQAGDLYSEAVRTRGLSGKLFSDNIIRELFDIGKLGIW